MYNQQSAKITREEIRLARGADLYDFLVTRHMELFRRCGTSLYMIGHDGIYVKQGFPGYNDFSSDEHGNPIDFLVRHLGYSFTDAVNELNRFHSVSTGYGARTRLLDDGNTVSPGNDPSAPIHLPMPAQKPYKNMYAYLMKRGIPAQIIRDLEVQDLIYQEKNTNNIVFINPEKDYCELRGTFTYAATPFHGCRKAGPDRFWYMSEKGNAPKTAYICEAAIDAISLYTIHKNNGLAETALYVSIGGVANQKAILRVKGMFPAVLAVDNDPAGDECRNRNPDLPSIIPAFKDWNEDLQKLPLS